MSTYATTTPSTAPWDTPGLPDRAPAERCRWHPRLCAFRSDDPARCPLCHATVTTGKCTCVPRDDDSLTGWRLDAALRLAHTITPKELAEKCDLTMSTARRIHHHAYPNTSNEGIPA